MFLAHMPGGFLLTRQLLRRHRQQDYYSIYMLCGLLASIAPDLDLFYFHLIDNRQHPHHSYWSHIPAYWLGIYLLLLWPAWRWGKQHGLLLLNIILLNGLLHMSLDSVASGIKWLYPFDNAYFGLWRIPARFNWWVANYLFHWTFLLELIIITSAAFTLYRDRRLLGRIIGLYRKIMGFAWLSRYD